MADVFISYHVNSAGKLVRQIVNALEHAGISCWYAERDLTHGSFPEQIVRAIENCKVFLVILDKQSNSSAHVANEIAVAFQHYYERNEIAMIPFYTEKGQLKDGMRYYLAPFQYFDACPPTEERIQELTYEIAKILGREFHASPPAHKDASVVSAIKRWFNRILNR